MLAVRVAVLRRERGRPVPVRGIIISTGSRRGTAVCSDFLVSVMASPHVKTTVAL